MWPLLDLLSEMKQEEWCSLLRKVQLTKGDGTFLVPSCESCKTTKDYEALTLEDVRQFVIDHYSEVFKYQVFDMQTGKPVLNVASSSGVEVGPFIHFCHLGTAFEVCGTLFTGTGKALSLSNIALLSTICHHLLFRSSILLELYVFGLFLRRSPLTPFKCYRPGPDGTVSFIVDKGSVVSQNATRVIKDVKLYARVEDDIVLYKTHELLLCALCLQTGTTTVLDSFHPYMRLLAREQKPVKLRTYALSDDDIIEELREKASSTYTFTDLSSDDTYEAIERASVLSTVSPIIAFELENLPDEGKKVFFCDGVPCLSPAGVIWVAKPFVNDAETVVYLFRVIHPYPEQHSNNPEYVIIKEVAQFGFTNDHSFFLYLSVHNTLHAFSLQSGTILQSVSGVSPLFFNFEGQAGYHFQVDDEGKTLLLQDFPCDFLKHFLIPSARKSMQANFVSDDTFLVLYADSSVRRSRQLVIDVLTLYFLNVSQVRLAHGEWRNAHFLRTES